MKRELLVERCYIMARAMFIPLATILFLFLSLPASAMTTTTCALDNPDVTDNVQNNIGCLTFDGFTNLDADFTTSGGTVVDFLDKDNSGEFGDGGDLTITGDTKDGTWSINSFITDMTYLLVFKDGTNALPASQVGYFVSEASGTYTSPFYGDVGQQKDISFVSLFKVDGDCPDCGPRINPIPLPAGAWLLLGGLGLLATRRKRAA